MRETRGGLAKGTVKHRIFDNQLVKYIMSKSVNPEFGDNQGNNIIGNFRLPDNHIVAKGGQKLIVAKWFCSTSTNSDNYHFLLTKYSEQIIGKPTF